MNENLQKCDVCGATAISVERDLLQTWDKESFARYEHTGMPRFGCKEHPPSKSRTFTADQLVVTMEDMGNGLYEVVHADSP